MTADVICPHDEVSERVVVACILRDAGALRLAAEQLTAAHFFRDSYRRLFTSALDLQRREIPVNVYTIGCMLHDRGELEGAGGGLALATIVDELETLARDEMSPALVGFAVEKVIEAHERRQLSNFLRAADARVWSNGIPLTVFRTDLRHDLAELGILGPPKRDEPDRTVGADTFLAEPPELRWDIAGVRVQGDHGWTGAAPKTMKGLFSIEEARANATGTLFLAHFPARKARVLYVSEEDRPERLHRRVHAMLTGRPPEEIPGPEDLRFLIKAGVRLDISEGVSILSDHIARWRPELVFLEHFDKLHSRDSNKADEVKPLLDVLDGLHREFACTFRVQKHHRKQSFGQSKRKGEMLSGSVALFGWGESSVSLTLVRRGVAQAEAEAKDGDTAGRFLVTYESGRLTYGGEVKSDRREESQAAILDFLERSPGASRDEVAGALKVSGRTAGTYLRAMEKENLVVGKAESSKQPKRWWVKGAETTA